MPKATNALTRKAGPLPVWAWAAVAVGAWFLFFRGGGQSAETPVPVGPSTSGDTSGAQQPASGQGGPTDNLNSDLLDALLANQKSSYDALLHALQYGPNVGGSAAPVGSGGSADTSFATAGTVDSGANNAPTDSFATPTTSDVTLTSGLGGAEGYSLLNPYVEPTVTSSTSGLGGAEGYSLLNPYVEPAPSPAPSQAADPTVYYIPATDTTTLLKPAVGVYAE